MIDLWWARVGAVRPEHRTLLDDAERNRLDGLRFPGDRGRFLAAATLARLAVGQRTGVPAGRIGIDRSCSYCSRPHGRPRRADGIGPIWSVSHTGDRVLVALADARAGAGLGVDLERVDPDRAPPARLVLSERERRDGADLWRTWVVKEAVLKATGDGLRRAMTSLTATPATAGTTHRRVAVDGRPDLSADVLELPAPQGYVGALAVLGTLRPPPFCGVEVRHHDAEALFAAPVAEEAARR